MNSPGGYQLIGRTLPIWNMFTRAGPFEEGKPWLLRNFDRIRYYEVSEDELNSLRKSFRNGQLSIDIEDAVFSLEEYNQLVMDTVDDVAAMKSRQKLAMKEQMKIDAEQLALMDNSKQSPEEEVTENLFHGKEGDTIRSQVTGTVWEIKVNPGDNVQSGDTLIVLEAMKMEYAVQADKTGKVTHVGVLVGDMVQQGAPLCLVV